jgi:alkyldihydroxyacetonephosphate synthase
MVEPLASLAERLPEGTISTHPGELSSRSRDAWALAMLREARGERLPRPMAVVFPRTTDHVAATLAWASETKTPVVPRGGGSGVCGGAQAVWRGLVIDLSRMDRILDVDEASFAVTVEAGAHGDRLESALNERSLTLGHYPQSMAISSVGGWIATASAGQASAGYGVIEDMLLGMTVVLPAGDVVYLPATPRSAAGPDLRRLLVGSEGTLGIVTEASLAVSPLPEGMRWAAFRPASFEHGVELVRAVMHSGAHPDVVRLYDEVDAAVTFGAAEHAGGPVLVLGFRDGDMAEAGVEVCGRLAAAAEATVLLASLGEHWWDHRHDAVGLYRQIMGEERALGAGVVVDTMEVAGLWGRLPELHASVRATLLSHASEGVGCHLSHPYRSGASLYFTFLLRTPDDEAAERAYLAAWQAAVGACRKAGGTMTHHHGIGLLKAPFLADELGPGGVAVLRAIKRALDPAGVLNPGKLLSVEPL